MRFEMDRTRLTVIVAASLVLVVSIVGLIGIGNADTNETSSQTTAAATITSLTGDPIEISVPTTDVADGGATSATTVPSATQPASPIVTAARSDATADTATLATSSPTVAGEKRGCAEGLVLVGSNGTEPICQQPGAGCPDGYGVIGGVNGALLCKGPAGDVLRIQPDGTVTIDTSVPFNGPVCIRSNAEGVVVELTVAISEQECLDRGGVYHPDGLG